MAHIDTLEMYREYLSSGYTEEQAISAVKALNSSFDGVATKQDLHLMEKDIKTDLKIEIKDLEYSLKIFFGYIIVGFIALEIIWPIIAKK